MNIEQLKLTIEQKNTPWDDVRAKTEKYSYTPHKSTNPESLAGEMFSAALQKAFSGQAITTSQSNMVVWYLNNKIFVRLDVYENTLGSPRRTGSALFTSENGQEFTKTIVSEKLQGVWYINGRFIVNDINGIYYSKTGYNWDYVSGEDISENCDYIRDIIHDGKKYVVLFDDSDDVQYIAKAKKIKTGWECFELDDVEAECCGLGFSDDIYYLEGENEDGLSVVYTSDDAEYWCEADESDASDSDDVEVGDYYIEEDEDDDNLYLCRKAAPYDSDRIYDENIFFFCENNREIYAKELPKGKKYKLADAPFDVKYMFFHESTLLLFGTHLEYAAAEVSIAE